MNKAGTLGSFNMFTPGLGRPYKPQPQGWRHAYLCFPGPRVGSYNARHGRNSNCLLNLPFNQELDQDRGDAICSLKSLMLWKA